MANKITIVGGESGITPHKLTPNAATQGGDHAAKEVIVTAKHNNTGNIFVGGSAVTNDLYAAVLKAGESAVFTVINSNMLYMKNDVAGEICYYTVIV